MFSVNTTQNRFASTTRQSERHRHFTSGLGPHYDCLHRSISLSLGFDTSPIKLSIYGNRGLARVLTLPLAFKPQCSSKPIFTAFTLRRSIFDVGASMSNIPTIPLTFHPAYCFSLSPTYSTWARLTVSDVLALKEREGFEGT